MFKIINGFKGKLSINTRPVLLKNSHAITKSGGKIPKINSLGGVILRWVLYTLLNAKAPCNGSQMSCNTNIAVAFFNEYDAERLITQLNSRSVARVVIINNAEI